MKIKIYLQLGHEKVNKQQLQYSFQVHNIDAIHPGYGFLSERSDFAAACESNGITFIGPRAQVMAKMGDKVSARQSALDAGLPIIPGTDTALSDAEVMIVQKGIQDEKRFKQMIFI